MVEGYDVLPQCSAGKSALFQLRNAVFYMTHQADGIIVQTITATVTAMKLYHWHVVNDKS